MINSLAGKKTPLNVFIDGQNVNGYNRTNLNNCFQDVYFLNKVLFLSQIRQHIPIVQAIMCSYISTIKVNGFDIFLKKQ